MVRGIEDRLSEESSFFSESTIDAATNFCIAYGLTWMLLKANPFNAGVFVSLFSVINNYAKQFFDKYCSPRISWVLSITTAFFGARAIGTLLGCHLTIRQALSVLLITQIAIHLILFNCSIEDEEFSS